MTFYVEDFLLFSPRQFLLKTLSTLFIVTNAVDEVTPDQGIIESPHKILDGQD